MNTSVFIWGLTIALIIGLLLLDLVLHLRSPRAPTLRESATWSSLYIGIALVFGAGVTICGGHTAGEHYLTGYLTEKALSVDNMCAFWVIMHSLAMPRVYQQKALLLGICIALVFRSTIIFAGAALIDTFTWIFYVFGIVLMISAWRLLRPVNSRGVATDNFIICTIKRILPVSNSYDQDKLLTVQDNKRSITPMFLSVVAIGAADIVFALDSVPAIFGITQNIYLAFAATAFSLLGLRQLYFLIDSLLDRLIYLSYALAIILGLIGIKLVLHALRENTVPLINGGQPVAIIEIGTVTTLVVIITVLTTATVASLVSTKGRTQASIAAVRQHASGYPEVYRGSNLDGEERTYAMMLDAKRRIDALPPEHRAVNSEEQLPDLINRAHAKHCESANVMTRPRHTK